MKNLLYKELKLSIHPTNYLFLALPLMLLIPNYPSYVAYIYMCLSLFFLFLLARENKDVYFSSLLPIQKTDQVKARVVVVMALELLQILISIPFAILHFTIPIINQAGIEPNLAFFGFQFGMFAVFNLFFLTGFYKTAHKIGIPLLIAGIVSILYYILAESLVWISNPFQSFLDSTVLSVILKQWPILLIGITIWVCLGYITYKISANRFLKVDV